MNGVKLLRIYGKDFGISGVRSMRFVVMTSVDEVGELLFHFLHVVVEGDLLRSGFSLVCVVTMTVMDEVRELLEERGAVESMRFVLSMVGVVSVSVMDVIRELLFHLLHVVVEGDLGIILLIHSPVIIG
jgi:hypothetical protein